VFPELRTAHLQSVFHSNRSAFLRLSKSYADRASLVVARFRKWHVNLIRNFIEFAGLHFRKGSWLKSIYIPASVVEIDGPAFSSMNLFSIMIEEGNSRLRVSGEFLVNFACGKLIRYNFQFVYFRYFGSSRSVTDECNIEILSKSCFPYCTFLSELAFESDSRLRRIEVRAFSKCSSLRMISIPPSVHTIDGSAFPLLDKCPITIDEHNSHFRLNKNILVGSTRTKLIRYLDYLKQ
jgi:hypothetical protein